MEAIRRRRSMREYDTRPVEADKLGGILEAGRLSPSANNQQPWTFLMVTDPATLEKLSAATNQTWTSPAMVVGCADPSVAWVRDDGEEYWKVDVAIAMQSMCLAATEMGLASCWICAFREDEVRAVLGIPDKIRVVALMAVGYAGGKKGTVRNRKDLGEVARHEKW